MRQLIYTSLVQKAALYVDGLMGAGPPRVYQAGSLGIGKAPASPGHPYMLIGELPPVVYPEVRHTSPHSKGGVYQVFVYDQRGDYTRADAILLLVRETLLSLVGQTSPSGAVCIDVLWQGDSGDVLDPARDQNAKFSVFRIKSNR